MLQEFRVLPMFNVLIILAIITDSVRTRMVPQLVSAMKGMRQQETIFVLYVHLDSPTIQIVQVSAMGRHGLIGAQVISFGCVSLTTFK
jgi:hypothetical protein